MIRSANEILGYRLTALDQDLGTCRDFLFDDRWWGEFEMDLSKAEIENGTEFDPEKPVNREYEVQIYDH